MRTDCEVMKEVRESHRGMVDGWSGGGMGYTFKVCQCLGE